MEGDNCTQYVATYSFVIKEKERKQKKMYWSFKCSRQKFRT